MAAARALKIAAIAGDGIGPEVIESALPVLISAAACEDVELAVTELDWGGDRLLRTGHAMPEDAPAILREHDAVLLGAVGHPELPPDVSVWSLILPLRKALDLYLNLRPTITFAGVPSAVKGAEDCRFTIVRENTEGEYVGIGGRVHEGTPDEVATEVALHSRRAITHAARYALELARERDQAMTLVTKSNVSRHGYALWDEVVLELAASDFADVRVERVYVDAMAARMIQRPRSLGVLLCSNLFGDILSDLGATLAGGLGMAPSANIAPDGDGPGVFEPVHGSAPDIAGKGIANPIATILSGAMLLRECGCPVAAERLEHAVADALRHADARSPDIGGRATTRGVAEAVAFALGSGQHDRDGGSAAVLRG
jgi:tartrate dehydrogenase/decarboxylase/D-malate dehydrogenase